jgi:hypothetical protein
MVFVHGAMLTVFDVDFRYEDRHVIAFLDGHPDWEAVEAFVADRAGREPLVRAILTRHDKTQVDLLNDQSVRAANPSREAYFAEIAFSVTTETGNPHAILRFVSHRGEDVALELFATTPALAPFGGLTDPQGHAPDVLPILFRDASAVGGAQSSVTIDGHAYAIPPFFVGTLELGLQAFYTEGFPVGIVSTGTRVLEVLDAPETLAPGARWRFRHGADELVYELVATTDDRVVIRRTSGVPETIEARVIDGRLHPTAIRVSSGSERPGTFVLAFDPSLPDVTNAGFPRDPTATFTIAIDAHAGLVRGRVVPGEMGFDLVPEEPAWAATRPLHVQLDRSGATWTVRSTIATPAYQGSVSP